MKSETSLDREERELQRSLEKEEWISDLTEKERKQYSEKL